MDSIYHEKQDGALCAQHCLNNLLQGSYFTPVDLADLARQLDSYEQHCMAQSGTNTSEYQRFMDQPSVNMDDSGFFSVQVLSKALENFGLILESINSNSSDAKEAKADPLCFKAYVCNYHQHWITVRKLGNQWFNLNSTLKGPELISDTYLTLYLEQLSAEGYTIFLVKGILPECEANQLLAHIKVAQPSTKGKMVHEAKGSSQSEEDQIHAAIALSLSGESSAQEQEIQELTPEELRLKRIARFDK